MSWKELPIMDATGEMESEYIDECDLSRMNIADV